MIDLLIALAIIAIVAIAGWFVLSQIQLPDPVRRIVLIVLVVVAAILAVGLLLQLGGVGLPLRLRG